MLHRDGHPALRPTVVLERQTIASGSALPGFPLARPRTNAPDETNLRYTKSIKSSTSCSSNCLGPAFALKFERRFRKFTFEPGGP